MRSFEGEGTSPLDVPVLQVIPATPQDGVHDFPGAWLGDKRRRLSNGAGDTSEMEIELSLEAPPVIQGSDPYSGLPQTDSLRSMARHCAALHDELEHAVMFEVPTSALPTPPMNKVNAGQTPPAIDHSPPFESFPSLPSLSSNTSINESLQNSDSSTSLASLDVEAELGSMLASLSTEDLHSTTTSMNGSGSFGRHNTGGGNPGLGLGLDLPSKSAIIQPTAPLSPRRRPPPLELSHGKVIPPGPVSAPPGPARHRNAFYKSARAHPNSPSSGVFISSGSISSQTSSEEPHVRSLTDSVLKEHDLRHGPIRTHGQRDSMSIGSEASDEDLRTASIVVLKPAVDTGRGGVEVLGDDVGVAL